MAAGYVWAWQALVISGGIGFLAFLTYLGKGYLDTWHGVATLFLAPVFAAAVWRSRPRGRRSDEIRTLRSKPNIFSRDGEGVSCPLVQLA
jgi:hypothetical protein